LIAAEESAHDGAVPVDEAEPIRTLITSRDGCEVMFDDADDAFVNDETARNALSVFGAWSDLDWDEAAEALDRIRHESSPTPPLNE
jgi:hypothetical protein